MWQKNKVGTHYVSMGDLWRPNGNHGSQIELLFHNSIFQCWIGGDWSA